MVSTAAMRASSSAVPSRQTITSLIIVVFRRATQNWRELLPEGIHDAHGPGPFLDPRQFQHGCSDDFPARRSNRHARNRRRFAHRTIRPTPKFERNAVSKLTGVSAATDFTRYLTLLALLLW